MKSFYLFLTLVGLIALNGEIEVTGQEIEFRTIDKFLTDFDEIKQRIASQNTLKGAGSNIEEDKKRIKKGFQVYSESTHRVVEWCYKVTTTRKTVTKTTYTSGLPVLQAAQDGIEKTMFKFNDVVGDVEKMHTKYQSDFDDKSAYIQTTNLPTFQNWDRKLQNLDDDITEIKEHMKDEMKLIGDLKVLAEKGEIFSGFNDISELRDRNDRTADRLVEKCDEYRKKHQTR